MPNPSELESIIRNCGGGSVEWTKNCFGERFARARVRKICADIYFGMDGEDGTSALELPLLRADWRELPLPAYVYTGRSLDEWNLAASILSWEDFPPDRVVHSDTGILKPSPEGLERICGRFGHERPIFFGDTASDMAAQSSFGRGWFVAIGDILENCDLRFQSVGDALSALIGWPG
jgi:phosphoglycolate phosphatase-like HAD superfamily hydrolase